MIEDAEDRIRERAHGIWEREGRPADRAEAHWFMAARELNAGAPKAAARPKAERKSAPVEEPKAAKSAAKPRVAKAKPAN